MSGTNKWWLLILAFCGIMVLVAIYWQHLDAKEKQDKLMDKVAELENEALENNPLESAEVETLPDAGAARPQAPLPDDVMPFQEATPEAEEVIDDVPPASETGKVVDDVPPASETEEVATGETAEDDPYGIFVTGEEWVKQHNAFCVERNGKLYTLCDLMPSTVISEYNCGYQTGGNFEEGRGSGLYLYDQEKIKDVPTGATDGWISIGDFPIYYVDSGEELRVYSDQPLDHVMLKRAEFYGYTIPATGRYIYFPMLNCIYTKLDSGLANPALLMTDGNPVEDVRKLEYGRQYMFEWYQGTEYHSQTFTADSRCYLVEDDNLAFSVPVKMTKNGYGVVDLSEVEPGNDYMILDMGTFFELR